MTGSDHAYAPIGSDSGNVLTGAAWQRCTELRGGAVTLAASARFTTAAELVAINASAALLSGAALAIGGVTSA